VIGCNRLIFAEHVQRLRDHLRSGHHPALKSNPNRYLDCVAYWRGETIRYGERCHELETKLVHLERDYDELQSRLDNNASQDTSSTKRRRAPARQSKAKRTKLSDSTSENSILAVKGTLAGDMDVLDRLGNGQSYRVIFRSC
jgi:predicted RNase H-like nuclease (RuvC/YqgF family)